MIIAGNGTAGKGKTSRTHVRGMGRPRWRIAYHEVNEMAKVCPDGTTVRNIMADGAECDDVSTYLKSVDQLPDLTKRLIVYFCEQGSKLRQP